MRPVAEHLVGDVDARRCVRSESLEPSEGVSLPSSGSVPTMDFDLTRRAAPRPRDRARLHRQRDRRARARERPQRALRPRAGGQDRRPGLPRRDRARASTAAPGSTTSPTAWSSRRSAAAARRCARSISVQTSLVCSSLLRWGTEEQKQHYLPKLCSGEWLGCFGLTEPDTGSDAANQRTRARRTDSGWVINGAKMWISIGNHAKVALIFAQTDPEKGHRGPGLLPRRHRPARLPAAGDPSQDGPARLRHGVDLARRRRGRRRRHARRGRRRLQGRDERAGLRAATASPPAASASARAASTPRCATPRSASSSAGRSPASSSCRR